MVPTYVYYRIPDPKVSTDDRLAIYRLNGEGRPVRIDTVRRGYRDYTQAVFDTISHVEEMTFDGTEEAGKDGVTFSEDKKRIHYKSGYSCSKAAWLHRQEQLFLYEL